jgi:hypothetical protein
VIRRVYDDKLQLEKHVMSKIHENMKLDLTVFYMHGNPLELTERIAVALREALAGHGHAQLTLVDHTGPDCGDVDCKLLHR